MTSTTTPQIQSQAAASSEPVFAADLPEGFTQVVREVNGTLIHSVVGGTGEPLVLLHGWPQTWREWRYMLRPLADLGYTVIAPDLRGTGGSAITEGGYDKDNQARDVHELLQALGVIGPVRMVGHDIGGMVAFSYARLYPEQVHKLALVDLAVPGYGLEEIMDPASGGLFHFGLFMTREAPELLFQGNEKAFLTWWFAKMAANSKAFPPEEIDTIAASLSGPDALRGGFEHYRTMLQDGRDNRAWGEAGGVLTMPVLAIGGEHSVGGYLAQTLRPVVPAVQESVIAGSGHYIPDELPEALLGVLVPFLA
ncbi:alpha/beta fold hydrolase [Streptomyces sp. NPDC058683]|uniref:alpha/beta fold hydrolase n=1 Tax=Streptomyces sp. NPDC058683 TaxID=3346597 RepID=UPI00366036B5